MKAGGRKMDDFILKHFRSIRITIIIFLGAAIAALVILLVSNDKAVTLSSFFLGPFMSKVLIGNLFEIATPLIFTGLAIAVQFQARQFNMGAEGSFFIGASVGTAFALSTSMPFGIHQVAIMMVGASAGALWGFIPGYLKAKYSANELVSSLMLNYVAQFLGIYLINYHFRDKAAGEMTSYTLAPTAQLPRILSGTRLHVGFLIAIGLAVFIWFWLYKSKEGYRTRMVGANINFAKVGGIDIQKTIIRCQVLGGAIAGLGGIIQIQGIDHRFLYEGLPGFGWDGVVVARVALNNPLLVLPSSIFLSYLKVGGSVMTLMGDVPAELVNVLEGIIILLISSEGFLETWRYRIILRKSEARR
ncbi:MAG: ABC transporter permease [Spirochaetes bacterium]|nr:ABC transporter permease [Spirochaetota bacterium]